MKRYLLIFMLFSTVSGYCTSPDSSLLVVFWNLENFFDYTDGGTGDSDREFSSYGSRHWTSRRFYAKCDAVSKSILWMGDKYGRMPDIIGLAEIENRGVLTKLLRSTALRKYDYQIIHRDSGDRRGIDVAIIYRKSSMKNISVSFSTPGYKGEKLPTRDILHAEMCLADSSTLDFIVNHHPSKYGGSKESSGRREAAMTTLKEMCDSLGNDSVVAMGDFNDMPDSYTFDIITNTLVNKGLYLHERGEGTIRYEGKWQLIDMFLVSAPISQNSQMEICRIPFIMTWDKKHPGEKPLRTYTGPKYCGGVSDHCPIVLMLNW